ncbi:hypothetical protein C8Q76DRAFT_796337 [Earliella scabrosa]|nr:hypothetical protein C8Q76DRAFT_796337 [Earliella scabrosa]
MSTINISYGPQATVVAAPPVPPRRKPPQKASSQTEASANNRKEKEEALEAELEQWWKRTEEECNQLSIKYGRKPEHYLHLMFSGGSKATTRRKASAFNAWSHHLAKEVNDDAEPGDAERLVDMTREHLDEYHKLTKEEKNKLVKVLEEDRSSRKFGTRLTQRGRTRDLHDTCKDIQDLIVALRNRTGVEGFFCLVRNTNEYHAKPVWYFTDERLERYLRGAIRRGWDCEHIAAMAEAFSVAGCDFAAFYRTGKEKADWYKGEIRDKIRQGLADITGLPDVAMNYKSYLTEIVDKLGVELRGYTHPTFANPSTLSTSLEPLRTLYEALESGECRWYRLTPAEQAERRKALEQKRKSGEIKPRKKRKDAGKKRKQVDEDHGGNEETAGEGEGENDGDGGGNGDGDGDGDGESEERPRKRRQTSS